MIATLLKHKWKGLFRSPAFSQHLLQTIMLGLFFVYFALNFLALGFIGGELLKEKFPDRDIYLLVGGGLIYFFLFDLIMRVLLQRFPLLDVRKYLHLPVRKSSLIHYLLINSLTSYFNFLPLFAIIPFVIVNGSEMLDKGIFFPFILFVFGCILMNNYLGFLLDRSTRKKSILPYIFIGILLLLIYADFNGYLSLKPHFDKFFEWFLSSTLLSVLPWLIMVLFYVLSFKFLKDNLYIEDLIEEKVVEASSINLGFLDRFGSAGKLINLETKLIWRNKRSRTFLFMSVLFLLYPMIFIEENAMDSIWLDFFIGIFVTGVFALNYGQLMLSWNSVHFDLLATRKIKIQDIFAAKYYLMASSCAVFFIFSSVYAFIDLRMLWIFFMSFLFNIGVVIFMYMFLAAHNSKRIDPGKGSMMNYEGIGIGHFLIIIPIVIMPVLIRWPFAKMGYPSLGETMVGLTGIVGFIFHKQLIDLATGNFMKNRYKIMAAFRKKT